MNYDVLLSNFAFNFNLRPSIQDGPNDLNRFPGLFNDYCKQFVFKRRMVIDTIKVERCRLTVS